jgi:hypothetical protein
VTLDPTLKVIAAVGGEDFASCEIVSKMFLHDTYLSFFLYILYHKVACLSSTFAKIVEKFSRPGGPAQHRSPPCESA